MIFFRAFQKIFRLNNLYLQSIRSHYIRNEYFNFFRNKNGYKNSVIQLDNDFKEKWEISQSISFFANGKYEEEDFLAHFTQRENVMKLTVPQIKDTMYFMANAEIDLVKYEDTLKFLDEKCAVSVDKWPLDLSLYVLDAWFIILGPKVFRKHYYCAFSNLFDRKIKKCSKHNLILILYFVGMSKKSPPFLMELLTHKLEQFASDLTDEEWSIACLSFFKTSTKMNSNLLLQKSCEVAKNLMLKNDRFNLIGILKCLRLTGYFDNDLLNLLSAYVKKEYVHFNFVECTNFLASFATQNMYEYETFACLEQQGISELSKEDTYDELNKEIERIHPSKRSRVKDLARFLWGMAFVGHSINQSSLNFISEFINARLKIGEFDSNVPVLVDCIQSFILFGEYPPNLIEYVLSPNILLKISKSEKAKPKYQVFFISRSAYLENYTTEIKSQKFMNNIPKNLSTEINERQGFLELINYLQTNLKDISFVCCYIMPHIMISGIFVATNRVERDANNSVCSSLISHTENGVLSKDILKILHENKEYTSIEILDSSVCVRGSRIPLGLMKTKIRHLQKLKINVITLSPEEIFSFTSGENSCQKLQHLFM